MSMDMVLLGQLKRDIMLSVNTSMPAKVLSYDKDSREAKVQPLYKSKEIGRDPVDLPVLEGVPALFQRFEFKYADSPGGERTATSEMVPVLQPGDVVLISFSQRELDDALSGQVVYASPNRLFPLTSAVIVGVIR